jgi:hypothetical protein
MPRPSNADLLAREPVIEEGTEAAVDAFHKVYPNAKVIEAESIEDDAGSLTHYEVAGGWTDPEGKVHIASIKVGTDGTTVMEQEERPDVPPGHLKNPRIEKLDQGLKARGPKAPKTKG